MRPPLENPDHRTHHAHDRHKHHAPRPSPRRWWLIVVGVVVAIIVAAGGVFVFGMTERFVLDPGETASDYLLRCGRSFERGHYDESYRLCEIALRKPARPRIHVGAARRMALSVLAGGKTGRAVELVAVLETRLDDTSGGAIRGAALHVAGRFAEAMAAYRGCRSGNPLLADLTARAVASRRIDVSHELIQDLSRVHCVSPAR